MYSVIVYLVASDSESEGENLVSEDSDAGQGPSTSKGKKSSTAKSSKGSPKKRSKPLVVEEEEEEEEDEISDNEVSQKKFLKPAAKKPTKKTAGKKVAVSSKKRPFKTITKNYCPDDAPDSQHKYYFRAFIGAGFHVSLAKWLKNNQKYVQIRKGGAGANVPVSQFQFLKQAILDLETNCKYELTKEELTDESADECKKG